MFYSVHFRFFFLIFGDDAAKEIVIIASIGVLWPRLGGEGVGEVSFQFHYTLLCTVCFHCAHPFCIFACFFRIRIASNTPTDLKARESKIVF